MSFAATLTSMGLLSAGFWFSFRAYHDLSDWRIIAGAVLMLAGAVVTRLLPVLYGYESWRGGTRRAS